MWVTAQSTFEFINIFIKPYDVPGIARGSGDIYSMSKIPAMIELTFGEKENRKGILKCQIYAIKKQIRQSKKK